MSDLPGPGSADLPGRGPADFPGHGSADLPGRGPADLPGRGPADDRKLAEALRYGAPGAVTQVYDAYGPWLYDYAYALLGDVDWAAAALMSSLVTAYTYSGSAPEPERLRGYLYGVVRDECLERISDPGQAPGSPVKAPDSVAASWGDDAVRLAARRRVVMAALADLPGREREIADLTLRHGLGAAELADVLDISSDEAADLALAIHGDIAEALAAATGHPPLPLDRLPEALAVLPFAEAPAGLRHEIAAEASRVVPEASNAAFTPFIPATRLPRPEDADPPTAVDPPPADDKERARVWPALAAAGTVILLVALVYLALPSGKHASTSASPLPNTSGAGPLATYAPDTSTSSESPESPSASPSATLSPPTSSAHPSVSSHPTGTHRRKPPPGRSSHPAASGSLSIDDSDCYEVIATDGPASCTVVVTARSQVTWRVVSGSSDENATISASGGGTLAAGQSADVAVTIRPTAACDGNGGGSSGTVTFSPAATATVGYTC